MNRYLFTVTLAGNGKDEHDAWVDATQATNLDSDPTPQDFIIDEFSIEEDDE